MATSEGKKRWLSGTNFTLCIACKESSDTLVQKPRPESYERFLDFAKNWASCGDVHFVSLIQCLGDISSSDLQERNATWRSECYKNTTNVTTLNRLKKLYEDTLPKGETPKTLLTGPHPCNTIAESSDAYDSHEQHSRFHRSSAAKLKKELCFFSSLRKKKKTVASGQQF